MSFTIQVHGIGKIRGLIPPLTKDYEKALERGVKKAVAHLIPELRKEIRRLGLIKTGKYFQNVASGSLQSLVKQIGKGMYEGRITNLMEYSDFLEGRRNFYKGHPGGFQVYENTLNRNKNQIMRIFNQELARVK